MKMLVRPARPTKKGLKIGAQDGWATRMMGTQKTTDMQAGEREIRCGGSLKAAFCTRDRLPRPLPAQAGSARFSRLAPSPVDAVGPVERLGRPGRVPQRQERSQDTL